MKIKRKILNLFLRKNKKYKGDNSIGEDYFYEIVFQSSANKVNKNIVEKMAVITIYDTSLDNKIFRNKLSKLLNLIKLFQISHTVYSNSSTNEVIITILGTFKSFNDLVLHYGYKLDDLPFNKVLLELGENVENQINSEYYFPHNPLHYYFTRDDRLEQDKCFDIIEITNPKYLIVPENAYLLTITLIVKKDIFYSYNNIFSDSKINWIRNPFNNIIIVNMNLYEFIRNVKNSNDITLINALINICTIDDNYYIFKLNEYDDNGLHIIRNAIELFFNDQNLNFNSIDTNNDVYYKDIDEDID